MNRENGQTKSSKCALCTLPPFPSDVTSHNFHNFASNSKHSFKNFSETIKNILNSKTHKFGIDGKYLMNKGMREGVLLGKVLRKIEEEWVEKNFKISDDRVQEIIKQNS